jgi:hypothetical protein
MVHAALLLLMLEAVTTDLVFTISLKRSTQNLQLSTSWAGRLPHLLGAERSAKTDIVRRIGGCRLPGKKRASNSIETERWRKHMTRILFVGQKPETVDFSDPALPPGFDAEKINAGIAVAVAKIGERGWQGDTCMITPDEAGRAMLEKTLKGAAYDCVVIGGGLRIPPKSLALFEMVVNAVHKAAPGAKIAFNTRPEDTAEAAARQLNAG